MMADAIILAGGFGTRLRDAVSDVPKPLAPIGGKPFLDHQLLWLEEGGVARVLITAHHMADQIYSFAETRNGRPLPIDVVYERQPLGTGGAVKNALLQLNSDAPAVVANGDTYYRFDLALVIAHHHTTRRAITMAVARVDNCSRFGTVQVQDGAISAFEQATGKVAPGMVNCGVYVVDKTAMDTAPEGEFSMEHDFFPQMVRTSQIEAYVLEGRDTFIDIGTPASYAAINQELGRSKHGI